MNTIVLVHAALAGILLAVAEFIFFRKEHFDTRQKKNIVASVSLGIGSAIMGSLTKGIIILFYATLYEYRVCILPIGWWGSWVICFFADDLSFYWFHRLSHQIRFLWASHCVHHTSETFSLFSGLRVPITSHLTGNFLFWAWMPLLGIEPSMILTMKALSMAYQFFVHTEAINKMPWIVEALYVTPSHHRVHHGSDIEYLDKNHGGVLIIWDRLFGTFREETHLPTYGITTKINSTNPITISLFEYKRMINDVQNARTWSVAFHYLFDSPGWSVDGSTLTTKQLQSMLQNNMERKTNYIGHYTYYIDK